MLNKSDWEHIKKTNWYRQGGAINLFYVFGPYHSIHETIGYDGCILHQKGPVNTAFFDRDKEDKLAIKFIQASKKDRHVIDRWITDWRGRMLKFNKFLDKRFSKSVELWSDNELVDFLHRYDQLSLNHWKKGVLCEWTDPSGYALVREEVFKYCPNLSDEDINLLTAPEKITFVQKELADRLILMEKQEQGLNIDRELKRHARKYVWIRDNWAFVYNLTVDDFQKTINEEMPNLDEIKKQVRETAIYLRDIKKQKRALIKRKSIPREIQNIFYFFTKLTDWRDERKKLAACLSNHYLHKILEIIAKRNNVSEELVGLLIFFEITGWKLSKETVANLKKRSAGWVYYCRKNGCCQQFFGSQAKEIFDNLVKTLNRGELKGLVANQGVIRGPVKIVEVRDDFKKVRKGDIIVATMTRPEYIPIMKMAGGIVTNEGGITCHAAIVSRELNIPCIIGTQIATEVLQDGEVVEVDANHGIINIIK
jgi:phosphohistidine swiveling domain-containing protein